MDAVRTGVIAITTVTRRSYVSAIAITTVSTMLLVLAALSVSGSQSHADDQEAIPDANDRLTRAELRWCTFEPLRLDGEKSETDVGQKWEVERYNDRIRSYNSHCSKKTYRARDKTSVERELTPHKRQDLQRVGVARVKGARAERELRRVYVEDEAAQIRLHPRNTGKEIGRIKRWGELITTGRTKGPWYEVEWRMPTVETALQFGWVLGGLVKRGSGTEARFKYCETYAGRRAQHNEIVRGMTDPRSTRRIEVKNGGGKDAYVKLINQRGEVLLAFLVQRGRTATLKGIPPGSYQVLFATGSKFSRGCDSFSQRGIAQKFARQLVYGTRTAGWSLTLHSVSDGSTRTNTMSYDDFDRL